ncbi:MAG: helix-hairpin-helix domain-containing protein [Deltaproteobacteria bacterium]|nr:helix-hairpin-helix domain-containing protein [Deltaproteobacteria bacterium]
MKKIISTIMILVALMISADGFAKSDTVVTGVVNINTATVSELATIPGIGAVKADAIAQQRKGQPFASKDDLLAVRGIGEKLLAKISPFVVVKGETTIKTESHSTTQPRLTN